ncbi:hypothetical protein [Micromonospora globbae]|uniref:Uncharacterized protein n=1 Tax=Micromonospora globbae TaxID=1894969 RepID=A0A420EWY9_9ACTN|nr:hypothetical protein [Micromonospora globbae]RKF25241.1 hypothetical protein D7I43_22575 [Micromonospora globbae]
MICQYDACGQPLRPGRRRSAAYCNDACRSAARRTREAAEVAKLREELAEAREALAHLLGVPRE